MKTKAVTLHWSLKIKHLTDAKLGALSESKERYVNAETPLI